MLSGTLVQSADGTSVTIDGALAGSVPGHLRIVLDGQPSNGGGIVMTASSAALGPSADPAYYQGSVRSLAGDRLALALSAPDGRRHRRRRRAQPRRVHHRDRHGDRRPADPVGVGGDD